MQHVLEPEHTAKLPFNSVTIHGITEHSQSPSLIPSLTSPFPHQPWEQDTVSDTPDLSHEALPLLSSSNPLTIDGMLNKSATEFPHQQIHQSYSHREISSPVPTIYSDQPVWPLADPAEALLLRHFVQNLAIWVRFCQYLLTADKLIHCLSLIYVIPNNISKSTFRKGPDHAEFC